MQASVTTVAAAAEGVAMESSDSDIITEDDDAHPNNGRARLRKTSLSHVFLVANICGVFLWETSKGSQGENDLGLFPRWTDTP